MYSYVQAVQHCVGCFEQLAFSVDDDLHQYMMDSFVKRVDPQLPINVV